MQFCWSNSSSVCVTGCVFIPITIQEVNICICNTCELCSTSLTSYAVLMNNHTEKQLCFHVYRIQNAYQLVTVHTWLGWVHYHSSYKVAVFGPFKFLPIFALMRVTHSKRRQSISTRIWQIFFCDNLYMCLCIWTVCVGMSIYVRMCVRTYVWIYISMYARMYVFMYVLCMYKCVLACI